MTERPGRKALFTGAGAPAAQSHTDEIAAHVKQLNDEIASALSLAVAGKPADLLEATRFGAEYATLIAAVNTVLSRMKNDQQPVASIGVPAVSTPAGAGDKQEAVIEELRHRIDLMVERNPVPMLLTTPAFSIIEANPAFCQMSGIREEDLEKSSLKDFRIISQSGEGAKVAIQERRRSFGEVTLELPSGVRTLEQFCIPVIAADNTITSLLFVYNDKTEQKKKNEEIEQLKQRSEIIVQQNPMPIILVDKGFHIRVVNEAYVQMSGILKQELLKRTLHDFRILSQSGEGLKQVIQEKRRSRGEVTVEFPSGVKLLQQYGIPIPDAHGEIGSILIVYNDITDDRRQMEEIRLLQQTSNTIVQQNPIPILMTNSAFVVSEANEAYAKMSGISRDRIIGMNLREIKILKQNGDGAKVAIETKRRAFGEVTVELPSGTHILEQYVVPILAGDKTIASLLFVYNEVTEQRRSELDLQKKMEEVAALKQRSEIIVKQNPMPIMLMNTEFKIVMVNDAYVSLTGLDKDRLVGMSARDFRIINQTGEGLKKVLTDKKRSFGEITIQFPSGERILEQYGIPMTDAKGDLSIILCVYNDVTTQREQEKRIKEMIDEAKANAELLTQSAAELQTAMAKIAAGDLTYRVSIDEADPLVKLKVDYNSAGDAIRDVLTTLSNAVIQLDSTINDTIKSTEEIAKATEQVAIQSQKATDNAKSQLGGVQKISNDISEISASIEQIASTSHDVMTHAEKASKEGAQAAGIGNLATNKMQIVEKISKQSVDDITALNDQMRQISKIVNLITDIANQTNLLALNAAIEAARAGEHGRGFAVVAGEVKNLAGESKKASSQIETLIKSIQAKSEQTSESMKNSFEEIKAGIDSVNKTVESLNLIISEANIVSLGVNEITKATEDQAQATNQLMSGIESFSNLTRDNQQRMEDMAALAEESSASTEEIASASAELSTMAESCKNVISGFRIR
ncbi:PAS domain-containing methyl-accepting chemotaxis protein [uncultured Methanoregula sp.]|uniref:methyl-accepting chemotaxis protein n=1 Tax=uncultured Methanoregula sp. TaxID=1005933 RepID=UPI002AAAC186|nr:PAS domain-containing methyl-accepting chemotaxis protein [uncultured Methanoregula sp.]